MSLPREWSLQHGHHQLAGPLPSLGQEYNNQQQQSQQQWHQMGFFEDEVGPQHGSGNSWPEAPAAVTESTGCVANQNETNNTNCSIDENAVMGQQHANLLGSLFSIHSAPVYELASSANGNGNGSPSRPVSLVVQATATSTPVVPPHLSPPDDDEDNDNLLTISSLTARPLIAKSRELGSSRGGRSGNRRGANEASAKKRQQQQQLASAKKKSKKRRRRRLEGCQFEPLDGGYGWAVVFGAFFVQFWVAGLVKSYGVLYVEVMETFENSSASLASWIPAILSCLCLALAPVTSMLSQKYSCRKVVFVGGLFCSLGLITSYFATSLIHLLFTFGVLTGIGGGLSTTPGIILVSQYFDRHRAWANGICVSGTAAGGFVFPLLIEYLVGSYGFHGTLLILGGCMLHVCASASMYRPLYKNYPEPRSREDEQVKRVEEARQIDDMEKKQEGVEARHRLEMLFAQNDSTAKNNALNELFHQNNTHVNELAIQLTDSEEEKDTMGVPPMNVKPIHKIRSSSILHSVEDLSTDSTCFYKSRSSQRSLRASSALAMGGSVNLQQPQQQQQQQRSHSLTLAEQTASKESLAQRIVARRYIELGLLRDSRFIAMGLSVTLMSAGSPYMLYYLPKYVNDAGYTKTEAGYLVAISAAFDLCGRLGLGYLSDLQLFDRRKTYIASIVGAGIAVLIIPVANSFSMLAACVSVYGLLLGCWFLLIPVLLADQFGTEKISSTYGLVRMFQSIGAITVPPLSGFLCDLTKSYNVVFLFMGTCMVLGGAPLLLVNADETKSTSGNEANLKQEPTSAAATAVKA